MAGALRGGHHGPDDNAAQANHLVFQANGSGSFREGRPTRLASDDNGSNQVVVCADVAATLRSRSAASAGVRTPGRGGEDDQNLVVQCATGSSTHARESVGADGSEDGTGRGTPIVAAYVAPRICRNQQGKSSNQIGIKDGSVSDCLETDGGGAVAYNIVGLGQQGKNHAYEVRATGSVQGKGNSASGNEAGTVVAFSVPEVAGTLTAKFQGQPHQFAPRNEADNLVAFTVHGTPASEVASEAEQAACLRARAPGGVDNSTTNVVAFTVMQNGSDVQVGGHPHVRAGSGGSGGHMAAVAFHLTQDPIDSDGHAPAISRGSESGCATVGVQSGMMVRRLTPTETLRLQSLPDWWLDLDPPLSDSTKYRQVGNAGVCNVVAWILYRLRTAIEAAGG